MANWARVVGIHPIAADEPVHLVELEIEGSAAGFEIGEMTQEVPGQPRSNWQAVYDERGVGQDRFAFFFHYLDTAKPLLSPLAHSTCRRNLQSRRICRVLSMNSRNDQPRHVVVVDRGRARASRNEAAEAANGLAVNRGSAKIKRVLVY